jgi:hypothetical protein
VCKASTVRLGDTRAALNIGNHGGRLRRTARSGGEDVRCDAHLQRWTHACRDPRAGPDRGGSDCQPLSTI